MTDQSESPQDFEEITQGGLDTLKNKNDNKFGAINRQGRTIDPATILALRLETFLDTFLSDQDRLVFEYNFHHRLGGVLDQTLAQVRQETLTAGTQGIDPKKLIIGK